MYFPRRLTKPRRPIRLMALLVTILSLGAWLAYARLISWSADTVAGSPIEAALFRLMSLPAGTVLARRPPVESVAQLSQLLQKTPTRADLYTLRAEENERQLSFARAETDWKNAVQFAPEKLSALLDLADFYARRLQPSSEIETLLAAAKLPTQGLDQYRPEASQPSWQYFQRALSVAAASAIEPSARNTIYAAWIARYPASPEPYSEYLQFLVEQKNSSGARSLEAHIATAFPRNAELQLESEALLARADGGVAAELALYSNRFSPSWPEELRKRYYGLLKEHHQLRTFLSDARAKSQADPLALEPVLRTFFYFEEENNRPAADSELLSWQSRLAAAHRVTSTQDLLTLAPLFFRIADYDESSRAYYRAYQAPSSTPDEKQRSLAALISLLLDVPEQAFDLGRRDLTLYRNVATLDRHPGFLNGILSLALNSTGSAYAYETVSQTANTYFHRASASRFLDTFRQQFPGSSEEGNLEAKLFSAYAAYGQNSALVRLVPDWLTRHEVSPDFVSTALLLADAYSATNQTAPEFALYDRLLAAEAAKSGHVPLGPDSDNKPVANRVVAADESAVNGAPLARSPDYARVLDRYISRLTQTHRLPEALALYRKEIDRNPGDPGLYARLALFIEQNRLDAELAAVYEQAFRRFQDVTWRDKLARLYLRRKQYSAYTQLTHQITETFDGSDLALFLTRVSPNAKLNPVLYRQVNLYAHTRFPHNLTFVRNLLRAYRVPATADPVAYESLLRQNWFYDAGLRGEFFRYLSESGKLAGELAALPALDQATADRNVAAVQFRAEGNAWLTHFEDSSPAFVELASFAPGDLALNDRAISLERSLASSSAVALRSAISLAQTAVQASPSSTPSLTRVGEIYADHDQLKQADSWWTRIPAVKPGLSSGYLQTATLFWDYFQYADALSIIGEARRSFNNPALFAYEAGAIHENQSEPSRAIDDYLQAALAEPPNTESGSARSRLLTLARRKATATTVNERSAAVLEQHFTLSALQLRVDVLDAQNRRGEIQALLDSSLARTNELPDVADIDHMADRFGFDDTRLKSLERTVSLTADPVEKLQARLDLALFRETHRDLAGAERDFYALLTDNPMLVAIIRADADFLWREKQYAKAVATLESASSRAQPPYRDQLRREAAGKAADSGDYELARRLLDPLLTADPYNADLLAQKAATYSRAGDSAGLVRFYSQELSAMNSAPLAPGEKGERIAGLRRGYLQALITVGRFDAALQEYESLLNQFPEDDSLAREVARFASQHASAASLLAYYGKAESDSPRNYRWPLILARLNTYLARYPEALESYNKAVEVRPDRVDIFNDKASLETRLLRFADADRTYLKLYELSYHDSQYLVNRADLQLRLSNQPEAIRLLRAAYVDPRPKEPSGYVSVMRRLAQWRLFTEVDRTYTEFSRLTAGQEDLNISEALLLECQALSSLHRPEDAVSLADRSVSSKQQDANREVYTQYSNAIGSAAKEYLTPEEKTRFAAFLSRTRTVSKLSVYDLASAAGLKQTAADSLLKQLQAKPDFRWTNLQQLQSSRLQFESLGKDLEALSKRAGQLDLRGSLLRAAIDAYANAGNSASQLRVATALLDHPQASLDLSQFATLFINAAPNLPNRLIALAKQHPAAANAVVQHILSAGSLEESRTAVQARGAAITPDWINAYEALTGLYFQASQPWVSASFEHILGPRSVGAELADRGPLAGQANNWFYYAARFGDYLAYQKQAESAELLPATLEADPSASNSYVLLGDDLRDLGQEANAIACYQDALQISPDRADIHDRIAQINFRAGKTDAAIDQWRASLTLLTARIEEGPLPADYWPTAQSVLTHLNRSRTLRALESPVESLLFAYAKRNGSYNFSPFVEGILTDAADEQRALSFILSVAQRAHLNDIADQVLRSPLLSTAGRDAVYRFQLDTLKTQLSGVAGEQAKNLTEQLQQSRISYATYLLEQHRWQDAWAVLNELQPPETRPASQLLRAAAHTGHLDELLRVYRAQPELAPPADQMLSAAATLSNDETPNFALTLREFEYSRELDLEDAPPTAYFGLAQVRFEQKRPDQALELIRIVSTIVGAAFQNLPESVRILEHQGLKEQAAHYAQQWKMAEPWNPNAQLESARLAGDATRLESLRTSADVPYDFRAQAAQSLSGLGKPAAGGGELALLTRKTISAGEASQPYFVPSRLAAARMTSSVADREKLLRDAIAIDPDLSSERLDLARLAFENRQNAFGLAVFNSYSQQPDSPDRSSASVDRSAQLRTVQELAAKAHMDRQNYAAALALYDEILSSAPDSGVRARISKLRSAADNQNQLAMANSSRLPVITAELTQPGIVKPRLASLPAGGLP